ncbi:MAG: SDR family oxidoreductase [candidate division Zixibacteria bacterium]|nr:SDR family oxidoreductase [candidate division Zixibacteria bacterium]
MYPELSGKIALVTGATRGFGRAIALRLAREGADVIVNYRRSMSEAQKVVEEITALGVRGCALRADIGKEESLDKMFEQIRERFGRLDILIANAAFGVPGKLMEATGKYWEVTMASSARSFLNLVQKAVPLMNNSYGRIVSITSDGGQKVIPGYGLMGPAKAALESLTRGLAYELAPKKIIVNGIMAGLADTRSANSVPGATEIMAHARFHTPLKRIVEPEDIAKTAAFLVSHEADMICGQLLVVDGGRNIVA